MTGVSHGCILELTSSLVSLLIRLCSSDSLVCQRSDLGKDVQTVLMLRGICTVTQNVWLQVRRRSTAKCRVKLSEERLERMMCAGPK